MIVGWSTQSPGKRSERVTAGTASEGASHNCVASKQVEHQYGSHHEQRRDTHTCTSWQRCQEDAAAAAVSEETKAKAMKQVCGHFPGS